MPFDTMVATQQHRFYLTRHICTVGASRSRYFLARSTAWLLAVAAFLTLSIGNGAIDANAEQSAADTAPKILPATAAQLKIAASIGMGESELNFKNPRPEISMTHRPTVASMGA